MINRQELLKDLQRMLRMQLEPDLRERCKVPEIGAAVKAEYEKAKKAKRTAQSFEDWRTDYMTQIGAAWILSCVFARFLEDNQLVDPPKLSGPGERLQRAQDEYDLYVHDHPAHTVREYLLFVFDGLAQLPGGKDIFGKHNLVHEQRGWISGDAAKELRNFWQRIDPVTGNLIHDFTDPEWDTRFLGDLYQELSEAARKKYALLQTPEFVEEFILDRTLEPALDEFGVDAPAIKAHYDQPATPAGFRMIDPACGSGHFLLGAFRHILNRWQKKEPGTNVRELVLRTLKSVNGVDLNPFAVAISRFRLLLAAMRACEIHRLEIAFDIRVACGDALLHGPDTAVQKTLVDDIDTQHAYWIEDLALLRQILRNKHYHCVVANPPYITPKDRAANDAYRHLYTSCKGKYALSVPFMERIFKLAIRDPNGSAAFTGQITANSFLKREFGKKLVEEFFSTVDLTCVIDTQLAHIPGHATATAIFFGRARPPVSSTVRVAAGLRREDCEPDPPENGKVWQAILKQIDSAGSESEFLSVADIDREVLHTHPVAFGGGGTTALMEQIGSAAKTLSDIADAGVAVVTLEDEAYQLDLSTARRASIPPSLLRDFVTGDTVRDWEFINVESSLFPHESQSLAPVADERIIHRLWPLRSNLENRLWFRKTMPERNMPWYAYGHVSAEKFRTPNSIAFAFVATHNHFVLNRGEMIFNRSSPVLKLRDATVEDHIVTAGLLNSSIVSFWTRQVLFCKGGGGNGRGVSAEAWERMLEFDATKLKRLPLPKQLPRAIALKIHTLASEALDHQLRQVIASSSPTVSEGALKPARDGRVKISR